MNGGPVPLFGIGPTRCGTSWLYQVLKELPEVATSSVRPKESHILDVDVPRMGADAFAAHFKDVGAEARYLCDITPTYCLMSSAQIAAIAKRWPDAKVLAFVRDPVARAVSGVMRARRYAHLGQQNESAPGTWAEAYALNGGTSRRQNAYDENIARWRAHYGDNVHVVVFDHLRQDPDTTINACLSFLGIEPPPDGLASAVNKRINVSSKMAPNIDATNELALVDHWLAAPPLSVVAEATYGQWQDTWQARRAQLAPKAPSAKARRTRTLLDASYAAYRRAKALKDTVKARRMEKALAA
ncbi:MAG: sulfotransferase [Pseudomonadota bacterium]